MFCMDEGQSASGEGSRQEREASDWPRSKQVANRVPGADEHLGLVSPQHHSFILRNLHISIYLHHVCMVIYREKDTCESSQTQSERSIENNPSKNKWQTVYSLEAH